MSLLEPSNRQDHVVLADGGVIGCFCIDDRTYSIAGVSCMPSNTSFRAPKSQFDEDIHVPLVSRLLASNRPDAHQLAALVLGTLSPHQRRSRLASTSDHEEQDQDILSTHSRNTNNAPRASTRASGSSTSHGSTAARHARNLRASVRTTPRLQATHILHPRQRQRARVERRRRAPYRLLQVPIACPGGARALQSRAGRAAVGVCIVRRPE